MAVGGEMFLQNVMKEWELLFLVKIHRPGSAVWGTWLGCVFACTCAHECHSLCGTQHSKQTQSRLFCICVANPRCACVRVAYGLSQKKAGWVWVCMYVWMNACNCSIQVSYDSLHTEYNWNLNVFLHSRSMSNIKVCVCWCVYLFFEAWFLRGCCGSLKQCPLCWYLACCIILKWFYVCKHLRLSMSILYSFFSYFYIYYYCTSKLYSSSEKSTSENHIVALCEMFLQYLEYWSHRC